MKKEMISNMLSGNEIYHRKMEYTCGICKSDKLPDNIFNKREIKSLLSKFKMNSSDLSSIITKCNCNKSTPKAHKLCALLNVIYNFELKCPDCHADYNLSVQIHNIPAQKACNIIQLILVLLINIIIYGACAFLILLPLVIDKEYYEGDEKKMYFVALCFFCVLMAGTSSESCVTISSLLFEVSSSNGLGGVDCSGMAGRSGCISPMP